MSNKKIPIQITSKHITYSREWFPLSDIREEHRKYKIKQVSCFIFSRDNKLLIVSKDSSKWGITAGHFEEDRDNTLIDTAIREVYEESTIDISKYRENIQKIGYYIVSDIELSNNKILDKYIQFRMFLKIYDKNHSDMNPKPISGDTVKYAKFCNIEEAVLNIRWLEKSEEWIIIKQLIMN